MTNDIEMLNCVLQNAEMGCQGITSVRKSLKDSKVDGVLCEHLLLNTENCIIAQIKCCKIVVQSHTE